jgi:hypothetical protein
MKPYLSSGVAAFRLLLRDYAIFLEYVHPDVANAKTYSHRAYELLLRACTEFESIAKGRAIEDGILSPGDQPNITSLSPLINTLDLQGIEVVATEWQPEALVMIPLEGWEKKPHGLSWYRSYNSVKHNRADKFSDASLENVTSAVGALFLLLVRFGAIRFNIGNHVHLPGNRLEFSFGEFPFLLRCSDTWSFIDADHR